MVSTLHLSQFLAFKARGTVRVANGGEAAGSRLASISGARRFPLHPDAAHRGPPFRFGEDWKRFVGCVLLAATLASPLAASAQQSPPPRGDRRGPPPGPEGQSYANSSAILVAEIAFARLAQEKGQWTAFRQTAADDAVMFVDQPVLAQNWLKGRADPEAAVKWQPQKLFMACDGRTGASTGASQYPGGATGYYTTVWQNMEKPRAKKPDWKWVLDHGTVLAQPRVGEEMISSRTAVCTGNPKAALGDIPMGAPAKNAVPVAPQPRGARASADGTMVWRWDVRSDDSRTITIELWNGSAFEAVVSDEVSGGAS